MEVDKQDVVVETAAEEKAVAAGTVVGKVVEAGRTAEVVGKVAQKNP